MISDFVAITGPVGRRDRAIFFALTAVSTALQAGVVVSLIPFLDALLGDNTRTAVFWAIVQIAALVLAWVVDGAAMRAGLRLGLLIMREVEHSGVAAIRTLDPGALHSPEALKLRKLVSSAGVQASSMVILLLSPLIHAVLLVPLIGIALFFVEWELGVTALVCGALLLIALSASRRLVARAESAFAQTQNDLEDRAFEFAWAQPTLRTAGVGSSALDSVVEQARKQGLKILAWQIPGETVFSIVLQLCLIGFAVVTANLYFSGDLSGVAAATMIVILLRIVETTGSLQLLSTPLATVRRSLPELRDLVQRRRTGQALITPSGTDIAGVTTPSAETSAPRVDIERVKYTFPGGTVALRDITLNLPAGGITVVVGESGSGKSTLLDVLAGLREPESGEILINDTAVDPCERLSTSSVVFQNTQLRPGTIKQNVLAGRPEPDPGPESTEFFDNIATRSGLTTVVQALPDGWDSRVGEGGSTLSGGERQRVGLARALAKPAGLLLIDEATSALDATTERVVISALDAARGSRTIVVVTHRPAMLEYADKVVVLDNGSIAEQGTVAELVERNGLFAKMSVRWEEAAQWTV